MNLLVASSGTGRRQFAPNSAKLRSVFTCTPSALLSRRSGPPQRTRPSFTFCRKKRRRQSHDRPCSATLARKLGNRFTAGGKTRTATVRGTRRDAEKELRKRLVALDNGGIVDATKLTTGQWLDQWLKIVRPEISPATLDHYHRPVTTHQI